MPWVGTDFTAPLFAESGLLLNSQGELFRVLNGNTTSFQIQDEWWTNEPEVGIGSSYDVRVSKTAGAASVNGPALGSWHALTVTREWNISRTTEGTSEATLLVELRAAGGGAVLESASYALKAEAVDGGA